MKDLTYQLNFSRNVNKLLKEDIDLINEKLKKEKDAYETMLDNSNKQILAQSEKFKELQDFFDRHEEIMVLERNQNMELVRDANKSKEETKAKLSKQLDKTVLELETIKSEFNIKMQRIRLQELELENKVIAQQQSSQQLIDNLADLNQKVQKSDKELGKKQAKIDDLYNDIQIEKDNNKEKINNM